MTLVINCVIAFDSQGVSVEESVSAGFVRFMSHGDLYWFEKSAEEAESESESCPNES